jgi:CRISPR/Cas system endoribonuclease Cas6 (RAMP superfamily)
VIKKIGGKLVVWILIAESNEIISSEKIEAYTWNYQGSSIIEINAKINGANYKICTVRILSQLEEHSEHNSLISVESQDGFSYSDVHIDRIRSDKLSKILKEIFMTISKADPNEIINFNTKFEHD